MFVEIMCVREKDGALRLCVDFRALNAVTKRKISLWENPTELLFSIGRANVITTIGLLK